MNKLLNLSLKDTKILKELEKDSRTSIAQIAKAVGVSKEVANYRIKRMLSAGFISRFQSVIDYSLLGFDFYRFIVNLHNLRYESRKVIIDELKRTKNIDFNVYLLSDRDLEINLWVKNTKDFYDFYTGFMKRHSLYIKDKEFFIITKSHIFNHSYLCGSREALVLGGQAKTLTIDEKDESIIKKLEEHPRISVVELSEQLKLPVSTIASKLKRLNTKKITRACIPVLNKTLLGYNTYRVEIILSDPAKKDEVVAHLTLQPNVTKIFELLGKKDIDFYVDFQTTADLDAFLENLRLSVPYIKDFEVINVLLD
jgi:Lrp/AsnC family transcriptional regulator, leucine-responsive regulatory protein